MATADLLQTTVDALNLTFPAVMRSRSLDSLKQLNAYSTYERWYNGEVIMHLDREVARCPYNGRYVRVRGEGVRGGTDGNGRRRWDWGLVDWGTKDAPCKTFSHKDVPLVGETKVAYIGQGEERNTVKDVIKNLGEQMEDLVKPKRPVVGIVFLPCWRYKRQGCYLADTVQQVLDHYLGAAVAEHFDGVKCSTRELQVISADGQEFYVEDADQSAFALLQLILVREQGTSGQPSRRIVPPPVQHAVSAWCDDESLCTADA